MESFLVYHWRTVKRYHREHLEKELILVKLSGMKLFVALSECNNKFQGPCTAVKRPITAFFNV